MKSTRLESRQERSIQDPNVSLDSYSGISLFAIPAFYSDIDIITDAICTRELTWPVLSLARTSGHCEHFGNSVTPFVNGFTRAPHECNMTSTRALSNFSCNTCPNPCGLHLPTTENDRRSRPCRTRPRSAEGAFRRNPRAHLHAQRFGSQDKRKLYSTSPASSQQIDSRSLRGILLQRQLFSLRTLVEP